MQFADELVRCAARWLTPTERKRLAFTCAKLYDSPALYSVRATIESKYVIRHARDIFMNTIRANHADDPDLCATVRRLYPLFAHDEDPAFIQGIIHTIRCATCTCAIASACSRDYLRVALAPIDDAPDLPDIIEQPHCLSCALVIANWYTTILPKGHAVSAYSLIACAALRNCCIRYVLMSIDPAVIDARILQFAISGMARDAPVNIIRDFADNVKVSQMRPDQMVRAMIIMRAYLMKYARYDVLDALLANLDYP